MAAITHATVATAADDPNVEINKAEWNASHVVSGIVNADIDAGAAIVGSKLDLTAPGPIGGTTPNTGNFTSLSTKAVWGADLFAFGTDLTDWIGGGANWTWVGGLKHTTGSTQSIIQDSSWPVAGTYYKAVMTISGRTAGSMVINHGGTRTSAITANGDTIKYYAATNANLLVLEPSTDFDGTITALSIKPYSSAGTLITEGPISIQSGAFSLPSGSKGHPSLSFVAEPYSGFHWDASNYGWVYTTIGEDMFLFGTEGTTTAIIQGMASSRFSISSIAALVLRAQNSHIELEGAFDAGPIEIVGYNLGSTNGKTLLFRSDVTNWVSPVIAVKAAAGQTGNLQEWRASDDSPVAGISVAGVVQAVGYKSSDGSAGVSAGPYTVITSITVKNGLITAITGS